MKQYILLAALIVMSANALSAKTDPCMKNKGISHCNDDGKYVCKDGKTLKTPKFCVGHDKKKLTKGKETAKPKKVFKDM